MLRPSTAISIVQQSKHRSAKNGDIVGDQFVSQTRLEYASKRSGKKTLRAIFANGGGEPHAVDLQFLLPFSNLHEPFARAYLIWGSSVIHKSRLAHCRQLRRYFFNFLKKSVSSEINLTELNSTIFSGFKRFLDQPRLGNQPLMPSTRVHALGAVKSLMTCLEEVPEWSAQARMVRQSIPENLWPGVGRRKSSTRKLHREHYRTIVVAAEKEFEALRMRWQEGRQLLLHGRCKLRQGHRGYRSNLDLCLAALEARYSGVVPDYLQIRKDNKQLATAILNTHGTRRVVRYLYASPRDLVSIALLIAFATAYNPDTLLELEWADYTEYDRLGSPAIKLTPVKRRANSAQPIVLDATPSTNSTNPKAIFDLLRSMTERLRSSIKSPGHKDRMFIFAQTVAVKKPRSFGSDAMGGSSDSAWKFALDSFVTTHGLEPFTLAEIRHFILDEVHLITGDPFAAKSVGQQKQVRTVWNHYTSDGTKRRHMETIGRIYLLRERWLATKGVIDPRERSLTQDKGSATPGFFCFDPFDSPRPNQRQGHLCTAYGECPNCPLAAANIGSPLDVAYYLSLRNAIYDAPSQIGPQVWVDRWAPILADLNSLLSRVHTDVIAEAVQFSVTLPPVG